MLVRVINSTVRTHTMRVHNYSVLRITMKSFQSVSLILHGNSALT